MLAGIDACKGGWMTAIYDGAKYTIHIFPSFASILSHFPKLEVAFIDIPIGLASKNQKRTIDACLRKNLTGRASTVFTPPCREVLQIKEHAEASALNREMTGKGLSIQSFNIMPRILEVDLYIRDNPKSRIKIYESHPELCFAKLNNSKVLKEKKNTVVGQNIRAMLISDYDSSLHSVYLKRRNDFSRREAKIDDVLDAMALLLANKKCFESSYSFLKDENRTDEHGIPMKIAFFEANSG